MCVTRIFLTFALIIKFTTAMRHIILCVTLLVAFLAGGFGNSFQAAAQFAPGGVNESKAPISWRATARMTGEKEGIIRITATMEPGWHIYGFEMPADGPRPTEIKFDVTKEWALSGKLKADKAPLRKNDVMFNADVEYWENKVTFTQRFRINGKAADVATIKCSVAYMGCNDQNCLPPKTKEFTLKILPKK